MKLLLIQFIKQLKEKIAIFLIAFIVIVLLVMIQDSFALSRIRKNTNMDEGFTVGDYQVTFSSERFIEDLSYYLRDPFQVTIGFSNTKRSIRAYTDQALVRTLWLLIPALIFSIVVGILLGVLGANYKSKLLKNIHLTGTIGLMAIPDVFLILFIQVFVVFLHQHDIKWFRVIAYDDIKSMLLPFLVLTLIPTHYMSRITTVAVEAEQKKRYIQTAKSKGVKPFRVFWIHLMKNALSEILGAFPSVLIILISCQLLIEYMFAYPGLALMMFSNYSDTEVVIAAATILVLFYFGFTALTELVKYYISPYSDKRGIGSRDIQPDLLEEEVEDEIEEEVTYE